MALLEKLPDRLLSNVKHVLNFFSVPHYGVNPRKLLPNDIWQIDVTHIPEFGKQKFVRVTIDTTGKTTALTRRTFVGKVMSLLLNMLSRLVIIEYIYLVLLCELLC